MKETENETLRRLLWVQHPCEGKYGDDGELQCGKCMIDFKRDSAQRIEERIIALGMKLLLEQIKRKRVLVDE